MKILVIGASRGLGRALVEGLAASSHTLIGVSRQRPQTLALEAGDLAKVQWIEADLSQPQAPERVCALTPDGLDAIICNVGIWEENAFSEGYDFLAEPPQEIRQIIEVNLTSTLLLLQQLLPKVLRGKKPHVILTGSTSALRQSGRPEVAFGATKYALNGVADTLRENFRSQGLAVTHLQLGYLNTDDGLNTPREQAAARGQGQLIPVHDVVQVVKTALSLSDASFLREITMPALLDPRF